MGVLYSAADTVFSALHAACTCAMQNRHVKQQLAVSCNRWLCLQVLLAAVIAAFLAYLPSWVQVHDSVIPWQSPGMIPCDAVCAKMMRVAMRRSKKYLPTSVGCDDATLSCRP
jgi:hypothetical protein